MLGSQTPLSSLQNMPLATQPRDSPTCYSLPKSQANSLLPTYVLGTKEGL
jgi:hypothetical protein